MFDSSRRAVLDLATTARRLGVKGGVDGASPRCACSRRMTADEKALLKDVTLRRDAGLDAVWLKAAVAARESKVERARAAVKLRDWGQARSVHAGQRVWRCRGRARCGDLRAVDRETHSRATSRRRDSGRGGRRDSGDSDCLHRRADRPVSIAQAARALRRTLCRRDRPIAGDRSANASMSRAPLVTDTETPPHLVRWMEDGRVVMAGADQPRPPTRLRDKILVQRTGQLMYELSRLYPDLSGVYPTHGWAVPIAATADGVMYAGPHRNYPRHLFAWGTQHDPAQAFLASRILLRHYLGESDRDDAYFAFTRGDRVAGPGRRCGESGPATLCSPDALCPRPYALLQSKRSVSYVSHFVFHPVGAGVERAGIGAGAGHQRHH